MHAAQGKLTVSIKNAEARASAFFLVQKYSSVTMMTNMNVGDGLRRTHNAADGVDSAVDNGRRQDHGTVNSANCATDTGTDGAADNIANRASHGTTAIGAFLSATDNTLGLGSERSSKQRECGDS